jgi:serine/threonine protein kinase
VSQITKSAVHCINPECQRPYPQPWGNKFCNSCGSTLQLLRRYIPLERLGSGGFAKIYTVWDESTQTEKVLKVLVDNSPKAIELFAQEAQVLQSLRHRGVPKVKSDGYFQLNLYHPKPRQLFCLVMEKIHGETLEKIQQTYPQGCPEDLVMNWFIQAVDILQDLHRRNIIHRDIKPSNLMLRTSISTKGISNSRLVLIDFGGAKQFRGIEPGKISSTRLFSSGYSPPEQITGGNVEPATDFYALGRTMIELLTGKYPPDMEDMLTGELGWRNYVNINPQLADLIDEMVQPDIKFRPSNAAIIKRRLVQISPIYLQPLWLLNVQENLEKVINYVKSNIAFIPLNFLLQLQQDIKQLITDLTLFIGNIISFILKTIAQILRACWDTIWTMMFTTVGATVGTFVGFILAYRTSLGDHITEVLTANLPELFANTQTGTGQEILLFIVAGLGTAWGLVTAGGFNQRQRYVIVSIIGVIAYTFGWLVLRIIAPIDGINGLVGLILTSVSLLTLSLGLRSHHLVYALITALGTAIMFLSLPNSSFFPEILDFNNLLQPEKLLLKLAFFVLIGIFVSFWLGVSHYLIIPALRFLGWR